jgi:hypothetical protein
MAAPTLTPQSLGSTAEASGTVALGAVHARLSFRGEQWPYYLIALEDGLVFLARHPPSLYDRDARLILPGEIPPGSVVRVRYHERDGVRWMDAVQIVRLAADYSPFDPIADDEAG